MAQIAVSVENASKHFRLRHTLSLKERHVARQPGHPHQ